MFALVLCIPSVATMRWKSSGSTPLVSPGTAIRGGSDGRSITRHPHLLGPAHMLVETCEQVHLANGGCEALLSTRRPKTSWPTTNSTLIDARSFCTCHARQTAPRGAC